jgi:hypothetical protein
MLAIYQLKKSCESNQNSLLNKSNKIITHWGSFLTLYYFL